MSALRKTLVALSAAGLLGTGLALPAAAHSASPTDVDSRSANCDREYRGLTPGLMAAFDGRNCTKPLGVDRGEEWSWADNRGQLRGSDNDRATSLINKGTGSYSTVVFYRHSGYKGGHICLTKGEKYADRLAGDDRFSNGKKANNAISSHKWTADNRKCDGAFMD
ncbi:hypothetical protein ACTWJ8_38080 [Streptomyces sp. SDT5-1]|uniref:hypothetical protein n=1 Tax=Streptomyces sp. SDT5-1 TaxID=3406418 RepID=UPI003FD37647